MDRPRQNDHLGVNKIGKYIRKSPLHQPSFVANANYTVDPRPPIQPQVYSISKNDFKSIVQQLTGSPSRESLPQPPRNNSPKPPNTRLQRIRPAPLTQINRPTIPFLTMAPPQPYPHFVRAPLQQLSLPQGAQQQPMMGHIDQSWYNKVESPISEYMRYLQSSLGDSRPDGNQMQPGHDHQIHMPSHEHRPYMSPHEHQPYMQAQPQPQPQPQYHNQHQLQHQPQHQSQPQPHMMFGSQPRSNTQGPLQPNQFLPPHGLNQIYGGLPSPRFNSFAPLHSPTSQCFLPSPSGYSSMFSPKSPYPLLSPGVQYPPPPTPNFSFSQIAQQASLRPGACPGPVLPQPPQSPGFMFPLSPSAFFPIPSPR